MTHISRKDFENVGLRVGRITKAEVFPEAWNPSFKGWVDFGEFGAKKSSAQLTSLYPKESLLNRQVISVTNFKTKQIANFMSEVLITGFYDADGSVVLAKPDKNVPYGTLLA
ncbi:tRNA-binding protein [Candidatus Woesearchaeota archaeon]|nr:tRNA-binding protein [Candidatus Woesearchaeota archaeon]